MFQGGEELLVEPAIWRAMRLPLPAETGVLSIVLLLLLGKITLGGPLRMRPMRDVRGEVDTARKAALLNFSTRLGMRDAGGRWNRAVREKGLSTRRGGGGVAGTNGGGGALGYVMEIEETCQVINRSPQTEAEEIWLALENLCAQENVDIVLTCINGCLGDLRETF